MTTCHEVLVGEYFLILSISCKLEQKREIILIFVFVTKHWAWIWDECCDKKWQYKGDLMLVLRSNLVVLIKSTYELRC